MPRPRVLLISYAAVAVVQVLSQALSLQPLVVLTKPLLMPLLAAYLMAVSPRPFHRMVRLVLWALAFSWLGDVLLETSRAFDGDGLFLGGMGAFLLAHVLYIVAFTPVVRAGTPPRPPLWALLYVLYGAVMVGAVGSTLGSFLLPVTLYAVAICTMGIVASGVNVWTAAGAAAFVLSDSLIMLSQDLADALPFEFSLQRALVMSTYVVAQALIVYGVVLEQRLIWARETADEG